MKFGIRYADKFVGLFVLGAALFITAAVVVTGVNKRWFARDYEYVTRFRTAEGLAVGMEVKLRGFEIGKVERITLNDNNQVDIAFVIYDTYIDKVVTNSLIELVVSPIGLGGGLSFYPGRDTTEQIPEFSFIPSNHTIQGKELIEAGLVDIPAGQDAIAAIMENVNPILTDLDALLRSMNGLLGTVDGVLMGDRRSPLGGMLHNLEDTTAGLNEVLPLMQEIMQDVDSITGSIALLSAELEDPTGLVPKLLDPSGSLDTLLNDDNVLFDQIRLILEDVHVNLSNLSVLTGDLKGITPELSAALDEATGALREGEKVLEGLSNNPLLRKGISDEVDAPYQQDSLRDEEF